VSLSSLSKREHPPEAHHELLRVKESRDCLEVLGIDIHQNELGLDPALLGELRIGCGD
jgi:hypothetical protein